MEKQAIIKVEETESTHAINIDYSVDAANQEVITFDLVRKIEATEETGKYSEELASRRYFVLGSDNQDFELSEEEIKDLRFLSDVLAMSQS